MLEGQAVNALDGSAGPGVSVRVGDNRAVVTDAAGAFQVDVGAAGTYAAVLHGGAFVNRETSVAAPGSRARLSLIPSSFDLEAFDQMYRTSHGQLQRWTTQPRLVLVATVMNYRGANGDEYAATREQMTDDEVSLMLAHLTEGLTMLTGGTYSSFASVEIERPASDATGLVRARRQDRRRALQQHRRCLRRRLVTAAGPSTRTAASAAGRSSSTATSIEPTPGGDYCASTSSDMRWGIST